MHKGSPRRRRGQRALGEAQGSLGSAENRDRGSVCGVEHDPRRRRKLGDGHCHHRFELRPEPRLLLDRPAGELLNFRKTTLARVEAALVVFIGEA